MDRSIQKERENFYRHLILVKDYAKDSLTSLIELDLLIKQLSFEDFIASNFHAIYHMWYKKHKCCRYAQQYKHDKLPQSRRIQRSQIEILFDQCNSNTRCLNKDCCCHFQTKQNLSLKVLDVTLAGVLLTTFCFDVFWHVCLQNQNAIVTFETFLNQNKHDIYHMLVGPSSCCQCSANYLFADKRSVLVKQQWSILFDKKSSPCQKNQQYLDCEICSSNAIKGLDYSKLNTIISGILLDEFCPIRKAITVLIDIRNEYAHISEARISDAVYEDNGTKAKQAMVQIAKVCQKEDVMIQKLEDLSSRPLDEMILLKYHAELIKQQDDSKLASMVLKRCEDMITKTTNRFSEMISQMQKVSNDVETQNTTEAEEKKQKLKKSKDICKADINNTKNEGTFVSTTAFSTAMDYIFKHGCVVITGHPGAGKSRLGLELLHQYTQQHKEYTNSAVKSSLADFQENIDIDDHCIILLDDIFGKTISRFNEENDFKYVDALTSYVNGKKVKVVITIRESVKRMCISFINKMRLFKNVVDLGSERFKMSRENKKQCIENYLKFNQIEIVDDHKRFESHLTVQSLSSQNIDEIVEIDESPILGFPEACYLFTSNETFLQQGVNFFRHANEVLLREIKQIKERIDKGKIHFTVLAYTLFNGDKLDVNNLNLKHLSSTFHSVFKGNTAVLFDYNDIQTSVEFLKGYLLKEEIGKTLCFQHRSIFEAVFLVVSECQMSMDETIKLMDFDFIIEMTRSEEYEKLQGDVLFVIPSVNYKDLADRIIFHLRYCKDKDPFSFFKRLCESPILQQSGSEVIKAMLQHEEAIINVFSERKYSLKFSERKDQSAISSWCPFVMAIAFMIYCSDGTLLYLESYIRDKLASNNSLRKQYEDASMVSFLIFCRICNSEKAKTIWDILKSEKRNDDISDQVLVHMHEILKNEKSLRIFLDTVDNHTVLNPNIFLKCLYFKDVNIQNVETIINTYGQCVIDMDLAMNLACCNGNVELVRYFLIEHKYANFDMISAMNKACGHGNSDLITFLLETVENNKFDMKSAMDEACRNGKVEIVESLLNKYGTIEFDMQSAMNKACGNTMGNVEVVKFLINNCDGQEAIYLRQIMDWALERCHDDFIKYLLSEYACTSFDMKSMLTSACAKGRTDLVQYLLNKFSLDSYNLQSAMHEAFNNQNYELVSQLLEYIDHRKVDMKKVMQWACKSTWDTLDIVDSLLKRFDHEHFDIKPVINWACKMGHERLVKDFIDRYKSSMFDQKSAMEIACGSFSKCTKVIECLLREFDHSSLDISSALKAACKTGNTDVVELLLSKVHKNDSIDLRSALKLTNVKEIRNMLDKKKISLESPECCSLS